MYSSLRLPRLDQINIDDTLWSRYTDMVAKVIIPYQWDILNDRVPDAEPTHCLDNFRIAAGEMKGEHKGVVFTDTDVYKWLETVAYCIQNGSGMCYEQTADEMISLIGRAQQPDGYLNTYFTVAEPQGRWSNCVEGHELYCAGYLIEAGVAYFEATGKDELLNIARRFADLICREFGPAEGQRKGYPGHQEIELALVKLYRCTGQRRYLDCARYFIDERGKEPNYLLEEIKRRGGRVIFPEFRDYDLRYAQAHIPPRQQRTAEGHAVRAAYMYCAMADLAREDGDKALLETCRVLWNNITQRRMYITGGIGSSGFFERFTTDYDLPNDSAYSETCASIGLALFGRRMGLLEKDASYFDVVERALYNTVLAGISLGGDRYFYVNPLEVWPDNCLPATSMKHVKPERQRWFTVACCPPNVARTLASLGHYIYAQDDQTVYVNLFISSSFKASFAGVGADIRMRSGLLQDGNVTITVAAQAGSDMRLAIRIPDYSRATEFMLDNVPLMPDVQKGYAIIRGDLTGQHTIAVKFDVEPRWMAADPLVREDAGKVALLKGPCVYCLEEKDNGKNLTSILVGVNTPVQERGDDSLPGDLAALIYQGFRLTRSGWDGSKLYGEARFETEPVTLKAVPYCVWGNREPGEMLVWHKCRF